MWLAVCFYVSNFFSIPYSVINMFGIRQIERNIFVKEKAISNSCCVPYSQVYEFVFKNLLSQFKWMLKQSWTSVWISTYSIDVGGSYLHCQLVFSCWKLRIMWNIFQFYVRFEVIMAVAVNNTVFWDVAPCSLVNFYQTFLFAFVYLGLFFQNLKIWRKDKHRDGILRGYTQSDSGIISSSCYNFKFVKITITYFITPF